MKKANPSSILPHNISIRKALREDDSPDLAKLLDQAFPNPFEGRTFYKQQPHLRLLAFEADALVGHVGLDLRAITVGGMLLEIIGIIDLCVAPESQGKAIGSALIDRAETIGLGRDFSILFSDDSKFYEKNGYNRVAPALTRWFAIDDLQSHSVMEQDLSDCFFQKQLGNRAWPNGKIDLLGYLF